MNRKHCHKQRRKRNRKDQKLSFLMSLTSSSFSRDRNKYGGMFHAANREKYSSLNGIAIAESASPEEVDGSSPYPVVFISVTRGRL